MFDVEYVLQDVPMPTMCISFLHVPSTTLIQPLPFNCIQRAVCDVNADPKPDFETLRQHEFAPFGLTSNQLLHHALVEEHGSKVWFELC